MSLTFLNGGNVKCALAGSHKVPDLKGAAFLINVSKVFRDKKKAANSLYI